MQTETLIIGGGLAGLYLAWQLEQKGQDYYLIESRERLGGRIHAHSITAQGVQLDFDIGPSWFWPGQPRIARLIQQLDLDFFEQYADGDLIFEDETGNVQRGHGYASMQGSYRLAGSLKKLITKLQSKIPTERYRLNCHANTIEQRDIFIEVDALVNNSGNDGVHTVIKCKKVVLALPPRIAAETLSYTPKLSERTASAMQAIPTWMAGHAKAIAIYDHAFWREAGLSGDAMSRRGPLVEVHDASPKEQGPYALFGFMGVPARARADKQQELTDATLEQLVRLFGEKARTPLEIIIKDWAFEPQTATLRDHAPLGHHPNYGLPDVLNNLWDGNIILSSTEAAPHYGGYLEGALEAAELTLKKLNY